MDPLDADTLEVLPLFIPKSTISTSKKVKQDFLGMLELEGLLFDLKYSHSIRNQFLESLGSITFLGKGPSEKVYLDCKLLHHVLFIFAL